MQWTKRNKLSCTQPRFTPARCNRPGRSSFANLNSKAVNGKIVTFWLVEVMGQFASRPGASVLDKTVATCAWTYAQLLRLMDSAGPVLTTAEAQQFAGWGFQHLQLYSSLRFKSSRVLGASAPMRFLFQLVPKHHYFYHMIKDAKESRINPSFYTLLTAESFIGMMGRIARSCHRASVSRRTLERYLVKVGVHVSSLGLE